METETVDEGGGRLNCVYIMENYKITRINKIQLHAIIWTNFTGIC